jgi:hypothetical protein
MLRAPGQLLQTEARSWWRSGYGFQLSRQSDLTRGWSIARVVIYGPTVKSRCSIYRHTYFLDLTMHGLPIWVMMWVARHNFFFPHGLPLSITVNEKNSVLYTTHTRSFREKGSTALASVRNLLNVTRRRVTTTWRKSTDTNSLAKISVTDQP